MCQNCVETQEKLEEIEQENQDLRDEIVDLKLKLERHHEKI